MNLSNGIWCGRVEALIIKIQIYSHISSQSLFLRVNGVYSVKRSYLAGTWVAIKHHKRIKMWPLPTINVMNREIFGCASALLMQNNLMANPPKYFLSISMFALLLINIPLLASSLWLKHFMWQLHGADISCGFTTKINCWKVSVCHCTPKIQPNFVYLYRIKRFFSIFIALWHWIMC